jgi:hypothetical protein
MKSITIIVLTLLIGNFTQAQDSKYLQIMEDQVGKTDTAETVEEWLNIANTMERVALKETEEWLPAYYASFAYFLTGLFSEDKKEQWNYYDKAEVWINTCESKAGIDSSEVLVLKANIWGMQISLKPMKLGPSLGPLSENALKDAERINPKNPRIYLLRGQNAYYTPPMWGGDKDKAYELLKKAKEMFEKFEPASSISPRWGLFQTEYLIKEYEAEKNR